MILYLRHFLGKKKAQREMKRLAGGNIRFSSGNKSVKISYIMDFFTADARFEGEPGVSYVIQADKHNVLFDLGLNLHHQDPSPLFNNLHKMKLENLKLDGIFISHNHQDHVGGFSFQRRRAPNLGQLSHESSISAVIWSPVPLAIPGHRVIVMDKPGELLPGLASTGALPGHMFFLGAIKEHSLLIPVDGMGLILVTGCGHPGIVNMVRFAKSASGQNVFAVVGGLHLMFSAGRSRVQKILGSTEAPWNNMTALDIRKIAQDLRDMGVKRIIPSAHDTCDKGLGILQDVFGEGYEELKAGGESMFFSAGGQSL